MNCTNCFVFVGYKESNNEAEGTVPPHDIALVRLEEKLDLSGGSIQAARLPPKSADAGTDFFVAGWGKVDMVKSTVERRLKKV